MLKFGWSTLKVKDLDESVRFYTEVIGLKLNRRFNAGPESEIAFLGDGMYAGDGTSATEIELICVKGSSTVSVGEDISWGFVVDSLDDTMASLKAKGVAIHSGPFSPAPFIRFIYILDPNGFKLQLAEHL